MVDVKVDRHHDTAVGIVIAAAALFGQAIVLVGHAGTVHQPDSASYVQYAHQLRQLHFTDTFRTPGYPAVLAVFGVTGTEILQIAAVTAAPFLVWRITRRAFGSTLAAGAAAVLVGLDVYAIQWERVIGTEAFAYVSILVWAALLLTVIRTGRGAVAVGAVGAWLVLLRPIFLPVLLLAVAVTAIRVRRPAALMAGCILVPVAVLSIANGIVHQTWTMTTVAEDAVAGKAFRYDMQRHQAPARFRAVQEGAARMKWDGTVGSFQRAAPQVSMATIRAWAINAVAQHPVEYTRKSLHELVDIWLLKPVPYTSWTDTVATALARVGLILAYALAPLGLAVAALRKDVFLGAMSISVTALLLIIAFDEYIDFDRVRMPTDGIAVIALAGTAVGLDRIRRAAVDRPSRP